MCWANSQCLVMELRESISRSNSFSAWLAAKKQQIIVGTFGPFALCKGYSKLKWPACRCVAMFLIFFFFSFVLFYKVLDRNLENGRRICSSPFAHCVIFHETFQTLHLSQSSSSSAFLIISYLPVIQLFLRVCRTKFSFYLSNTCHSVRYVQCYRDNIYFYCTADPESRFCARYHISLLYLFSCQQIRNVNIKLSSLPIPWWTIIPSQTWGILL